MTQRFYNQLYAVWIVIEKIDGVAGINEYLREIEAASYYELVTGVIPRQLVGYCRANEDPKLAEWRKSEEIFGYEVMIVGDTDRRILPAGGLGFLFEPREEDYFQIRSTVKSQIIGLTVYYHSLRDQINRLILEKQEAEQIARQPWEKLTYEEPIGFLWGSLGSQSVRDWDGERRQAEYKYEMKQKAERLTGIIQMM